MKTKVESAHGGPGRIRTSNQTVMSAVTLSETSIKSGVFRHANQRMFTIGCGQSLAKRWLARSNTTQDLDVIAAPAEVRRGVRRRPSPIGPIGRRSSADGSPADMADTTTPDFR